MIVDPLILFIASFTFFIGGLSKGAMGFGLPMIAIPMLTAFGSLPLALSIAVPPVVATNVWQVWKFRQHRGQPFMQRFLALGIVGVLIGASFLKYIEEAYLEVLLGCMVLFYLFVSQRKGSETLPVVQRDKLSPVIGGFAGMAHGATGLSGLIGTPYFHAIGLTRPAFIFCNSIMFTVFSALHMPAMAVAGVYQPSAVPIGVIVILPAFAGLWLGGFWGGRLKASTFPIIVKAMLTIAAVLPIWNGLSRLFLAT
tara:strand:- start:822 stop:1583 length:762 start_codon:yes stop_codon:yes gene_type:complete